MAAAAQVALLDRCTAEFARSVAQVDAAQHLAPTPCSEWTVRDLVFHVATRNGLAVRLPTGTAARARSYDRSDATPGGSPDPALHAHRGTP